ncbi:preprotein translocase subunit YajC [Weeksellaceae bacterium TAE3-ERU29]|nr:preprotein translocase subunit YajC [Weeksellaceae bacterium TAE3-ERU29]
MEGGMMSFVFFGAMFLIMYFFMIRPQMQRQKREKKFQESLSRGMWVVTTAGIHGKVVDISGDSIVTLETGAGKIRFERSAISQELTAARYGKEEKK